MSVPAPSTSAEAPAQTGKPWQFSLRQLLWWFVFLSAFFAVAHFLGRVYLAIQGASHQQSCTNNLRQIAIGLANYHDTYGQYPPAIGYNKNGKPAHSWRMFIHPFLVSSPLYSQYRLDEPWNGPNNRQLHHSQLGFPYSCPGEYGNRVGMTSYVAITGPGTPWPDDGRPADFANHQGDAPVLVVVEVRNSGIHWMEPRDLPIDGITSPVNEGSGLHVSSVHLGGAMAAFADGHIEMLPTGLSPEELKRLLTTGKRPDPELDE